MGRHKKYPIETATRDPKTSIRDPVIMESQTATIHKPRRYIPASAPVVCPVCKGNTRMDDGRHVDPVRGRILEYRTCAHCGAKLAAGREMTEREKALLCSRKEAVEEYESIVKTIL